MKKLLIHFLTVLTVALLSTSCAGFKKQEIKLREFSREDENLARTKAAVFAEAFIQALKNNDFAIWQKHLPASPSPEKQITGERFTAMRRELLDHFGTFVSGRYLGDITDGNLRTYLWKLTFSEKKQDKNVIHEIIYFVRVFCEEGKPPTISRFGVKLL